MSCTKITGNLANLRGNITQQLDLSGSLQLVGVHTPVTVPPTYVTLTGTGLTTDDIDNTLIAYANATAKTGGTFTATGKNRTSASDSAVSLLQSRFWTINGATKI